MSLIRVLIADDHRLFCEGLHQLCEVLGGFEVVGKASNGQEAVQMATALQPDVVLMDIHMPVLDGVQATRQITTQSPETRVIILTMYRQDKYLFDAIKAGASSYLLKDVSGQTLVETVRTVHQGQTLLDPAIAARVLDEFRRLSQIESTDIQTLTEGEMDVLRQVAQGAENANIAHQLHISENTVANRLREIYHKLHVNNRTQAALVALRRGWVELTPEEEE